jgi:undecaprenyl-diphosphatase
LSFFDKIEQADKDLFLYLNGHHSTFWDGVMDIVSGRFVWIPFYMLLLLLVFLIYRKRSWTVLIAVALLIVLSDQLSVFVKNSVARYRPCHNLELQDVVHVVKGCGGQFGFVSSHAANTFALALFLSLILRRRWRYLPYLLFPWAMFVSYSRIYNGAHYPADIVCGGLLGMLLAALVYFAWKKAHAQLAQR